MSGAVPGLDGVILAAGLSSRMGGAPKALLRLGGRSLLERAAAALRAGGAAEPCVVTGHRAEEVEAEARRLGLCCARNPAYAEGMSGSVRAGLRHCLERAMRAGRGSAGAVFLLPVDAGLVWRQSPAALARAWAELDPAARGRALLLPSFAGRCGHPPLIGAEHLPPMAENAESGGPRAYMASLLPDEARASFLLGLSPAAAPRPGAAGPFAPLDAGGLGLGPFFLPLPDAGLLSDLDEPGDLETAAAFLAATRDRLDFAPREALEWLRHARLGEKKTRHCLRVGLGALRLGLALARAGKKTDLALHLCGGLLHDIARGHKAHAGEARRWIAAWGRPLCALTVGAHTALPDALLAALGLALRDVPEAQAESFPPGSEASAPYSGPAPELLHACASVYLADKFFSSDTQVSLGERFAAVKARFAKDPAALFCIARREEIARAVAGWFRQTVGEVPEALLSAPTGHPLEEICLEEIRLEETRPEEPRRPTLAPSPATGGKRPGPVRRKPPEARMMKKLYLIRHGEAAPPGILVGQDNPPLTAAGEAQARERRRELAEVPFSAAWSSPLLRARQTAEIILEGNAANTSEIVTLPGLREISLGLWDGKARDWVKARYPLEWAARGRDMLNFAPPGGESFADLAARALPVFRLVLAEAARHEHSLLAAHQAVNRVVLAWVMGLPPRDLFEIPQPPAALSVLEVTRGGKARLLKVL